MLEDPLEQKEATIAFKTKMQDVVRALLDLESALLQEDAAKAGEVLEHLEELEREGHQEFRPRRER
jgi:hypothetical protein